jgi:predicted signal transduction protein with EAL and GGDEF domain
MGKSLNLRVIAEGVENEKQLSFLRDHNCDEVQGYYFSQPLAAADFATKVRDSALSSFGPQLAAMRVGVFPDPAEWNSEQRNR